MKHFIFFSVNLILVLFQVSFISEVLGSIYTPNLVLALVVSLFVIGRDEEAYLSGLYGGLLLDALATTFFGLSAFLLTGCIYLMSLVRKYIFRGLVLKVFSVVGVSTVYVVFSQQTVYKGFVDLLVYLIPTFLVVLLLSLAMRRYLEGK